ncbi:type II toxin-antitoxin system VapC family toxin [Kordiimonas pumila]|uniref:Ribonuclease VapC n=1 Tax=Kordiimonas pumila TaxID=2161677 RepID=A0ABV7D5T2_9PROT|nr:PIN domain nuclease [Kordiimonas pumila]
MILVDSSVWIDFFRGKQSRETDLLDRCLGTEPLLTGDLIITEVLQGFKHERDFRKARAALGQLEFAPMVGAEIALKSAENYRRLRQQGITVRKTIDVLIATFCIENGHTLLHSDRDFDVMVDSLGLKTLWSEWCPNVLSTTF